MKAYLFTVLASVVYSLASVLVEYKFPRYNNLSLIVVYSLVIFVIATIVRATMKGSDASYAFPVGVDLVFLVVLGVLFFVADYLYIGSYTNGGDLMTITMLAVLFPVYAAVLKFFGSFVFEGMVFQPPNFYQIAGYFFAGLAVLFILKGAPS